MNEMSAADVVKAIKCFENQCASGICTEADKVALQALRSEQEREKGCEYCHEEKHMVAKALYLKDNEFHLEGTALVYSAYVDDAGGSLADDTFIHFCPMCGRKLEVNQK